MPCKHCGHRTLIHDSVTDTQACESCGIVQQFESYYANSWCADGPEGVLIRVGTSGSGGGLNYRDKKIYEAGKLVDELALKLALTGKKVSEIKNMISKITEGEFGQGYWFTILIGACAYIRMRSDNKSLSMAEISNAASCDVHELGRMVMRVVDFLNVKMPEFDLVGLFEKVASMLLQSRAIGASTSERVVTQGIFLAQCAVKWFLSTGRRPLPVVVAVLVLVSKLNGIVNVTIEEVTKLVPCAVSTCRVRYKEMLESLVKVAQALPWGKNVTLKNVVKNAPLVIQYMEMKSMEKEKPGLKDGLGTVRFDLEEAVSECLANDVAYGLEDDVDRYVSAYFDMDQRKIADETHKDDVRNLQLSHECLAMIYNKFQKDMDLRDHLKGSENVSTESHTKNDFGFCALWNGKSELSKKLILKKILEKDVGFNALPLSYVNGCLSYKRRRAKISAAKQRINRIMLPNHADLGVDAEFCVSHFEHNKKRRRTNARTIDWEDFVIETLLLHQVKEEELETGHYNTLLDLYVFNSGLII